MSDAKLFAITGFGGGVSIGIQGDTYEEFLSLCKQVYGDAVGEAFAKSVFDNLRVFAPVAQATAVVDAAVGPVSTVGQPLPQPVQQPVSQVVTLPQAVQQPVSQVVTLPQAPPPTVAYPGDCAHGRRTYIDKPARGKPWRRWECAIPWSKGVQGRCEPINVEN